jgi:predicted CDP-diglyceride synthetase/phosphatidate cytidylyltransferase
MLEVVEMEEGVIVREDSDEVIKLLAAKFELWWVVVVVVSMVLFQEE